MQWTHAAPRSGTGIWIATGRRRGRSRAFSGRNPARTKSRRAVGFRRCSTLVAEVGIFVLDSLTGQFGPFG